MKILANDGIADSATKILEQNGHELTKTNVAQDHLAKYINDKNIDVLLVRSATKAKKDLIDACPNLKMIGRGGVGMDNIDVEYARSKSIEVFNTFFALDENHSVITIIAPAKNKIRFGVSTFDESIPILS